MSAVTLDMQTVRRWRRYPGYRACDARWNSEVPSHWKVERLKRLTVVNPSKSEVANLDDDTEVSFLPMERIGEDGSLALDMTRTLGDVRQGFTYFKDRDVLVAKITPCFENGKGALAQGLASGIGFGTTELHILRPKRGLEPGFLELVTRLHAFRVQGAMEMYGAAGQQRVPDSFLGDYLAPVPPLDEQRTIVAFIERETARIDELVERKKRLIALLDEKRQSVVSQSVTRGLNAAATLSNSSLPWIGDYPSHWRVAAISWIATVCNGATPSRSRDDYWVDGDVPWVSSSEVNERIVREPTALISKAACRETGLRIIPKGSILLGMIGQGRTRGMSAILGIDACINQNVAAILPGPRIDSEYLYYALVHAYEPIRRYGRGGQQDALNCEIIGSLRIPLPPVEEQRQIAAYLIEQERRITESVELLRRHTGMLLEYRTALISAAVTGQIDVREEVRA